MSKKWVHAQTAITVLINYYNHLSGGKTGRQAAGETGESQL